MANLSNINNVLRVSSDLRVGINTDAASYALEIGGTNSGIKLKNSNATNGRIYSLLSDTSGNFQIYDDAAASGRLVISSGGAATFAGNVIVGSTNPVKLIDQSYGGELGLYYGTTNHWKQYHYSDNSLRFNYNGSGGDELIIDTSGNSTFAGNLTLTGATALDFQVADFAQIKFRESGAIMIDSDNDQSSRNFQIKDGSGSSLLTVLDTGNVGINNTAPAKKLEISSPTNADGILLTGDGTGGGMATGNYRSIGFSYTDTDTSYGSQMKFEIPDSAQFGGQISFWTDEITAPGNSVRAMTISRSQNVGIGTGAPGSKLTINGQVQVGPDAARRYALQPSQWGYASSYRTLILGSASTTYNTNDTGSVTLAFGVDVSGNSSGSFTGNGRELLFRNGAAFTTPNTANNGYHSNILVLNDGKVGIGTALPTQKLDVDGLIKHQGLDMTSGSQVDQIKTFNVTLVASANTWTEIPGIAGTDLSSGHYMVGCYSDARSVSGWYYVYWTTYMAWSSVAGTNTTETSEMPLTFGAHATNGKTLELRTSMGNTASTNTMRIQFKVNFATTGTALRLIFRKLIS